MNRKTKKALLLLLALLFLLPSCAKAPHSLDGLPSVREETLRPEEKTEFWKTLSPFSYTPDDSAAPADPPIQKSKERTHP